MLETLPGSGGNLVCFRAVGTLTEEDYADVFIPTMTDVLTQFPTFRLYADLSRLLGWDENSSWETGAVLKSNLHKFERAAIVGGPSWAGLALVLRDSLPPDAYEFYTDGNQKRALTWVSA
ncbi:MAG: STAS/SEC14 domain-containing protein [Rhodospirillaceae bacterium]|nr:STAS/SEC14 domain-containing protein [Rhodospirillaceae bacterium]